MRKIYLDCGAHIGDTIKAFMNTAEYTLDTEIYAFEPNPCSLVHKRFGDKINVIKKAVWIKDDKMNFYIKTPKKGSQAGSLLKEKTSGNLDKKHPLTVESIDFGAWIKKNFKKEDHIIVKMDIEGAEFKVIPSMIADGSILYINKLYLETHENRIGLTIDDFERLMLSVSEIPSLETATQFSDKLKKRLLVRAISSGTENGESSRLRFFRKERLMSKKYKWKGVKDEFKGDLLFVQKRTDQEERIRNVKRLGMPVVYDVDDGNGIRRKGDDRTIFKMVDAITTDSEERAEAFRKITDTPVYVVPDGIDYIYKPIKPIEIRDKIAKVCTFGSSRSTRATIPYLLAIENLYDVKYITDEAIHKLKKCHFKTWKLENFIKKFVKNDICILAHGETEEKAWKANTRLITAMSVGMPTIVANTPSFVAAMKDCDAEDFIINCPEDLPERIKMLEDVKIRKKMQKRFLEYSWENYHPQDMADKLEEVFKIVIDANHTNLIYKKG
jgi:FkbM family methyltransferase